MGVAIGDMLLDASQALGLPSLAAVMAMPRAERTGLRRRLSELLANYSLGAERAILPMSEVELLLPCDIPDYTDFFASIDHATNVGSLFRPDKPLSPNYKWMPIAYHGRASSIVVSGTAGASALRADSSRTAPPVYAPSRMLDYELEVGAFLGPGNAMGQPIPIADRGRSSVRRVPVERLVGARHPELGIPTAGAVPGEEFRDVHLALDCDAGRAWSLFAGRAIATARRRPATAPASSNAWRRRVSNHAGGLAAFRENASAHAREPERFCIVVLDAGPDDRAPHQQRLSAAPRRSHRQRDGLRAGKAESGLLAGNHPPRRRSAPRFPPVKRAASWKMAMK